MGICVSSGATPAPKTKLILPNGRLREFDRPVTVSHVLQQEPGCFVCDADEMDFDEFISALRAGEELRQGQLYFVLPRSALERPLHADDLAALAVKASQALMTAARGKRWRGRRAVAPLVFDAEPNVLNAETKRRRTKMVSKNGVRGKFPSNLSAILE